MAASTTLLEFLLMVVAGCLHRQQGAMVEYLNAEVAPARSAATALP